MSLRYYNYEKKVKGFFAGHLNSFRRNLFVHCRTHFLTLFSFFYSSIALSITSKPSLHDFSPLVWLFVYFFFLLFTVASFSLSYRSTPSCTSSSRNRESTRLDGTFHSSILFFLLWLYTWHKEKCIYGIFQINFSSFFFFVTQKRIEI